MIRQQFDINDQEQIRKECKPVAKTTIRNVLGNYMIRARLRTVDHNFDKRKRKKIAEIHGFRKFVTTQMIKAKINPEIRELLLGHKIGLAGAYYKPTEEDLYQEYQKAIPFSTIDQTNILQEKVEEQQDKLNEVELLKLEHRQQMNMVMNELTEFREKDRLRAEQMKNDEVENQRMIKEIRERLKQWDKEKEERSYW